MPSLLSYEFILTKNLFSNYEKELILKDITLPEKFSKYNISYLFFKNTLD